MKLQLIETVCKQAVTLVLLIGICLLCRKGIVPVYTIVLLLLSGGIISLFFRMLSLVVKVLVVLLIIGICI